MSQQQDDFAVAGVSQGEVLVGKYRVERVLGVGGMGVVVAAHHLQLDEKVALKFLLPQGLVSVEGAARFAREARSATRIKSEHVAHVTDVGTLENGAPYMVMEYLEGRDLSAMLRERGVLDVEETVEFVLQACEAIAEAHALGIVHRDLKPANLFCVRRSDGLLAVKVLDFGISKATGSTAEGAGSMTKSAAIMGSPFYMSPEQMVSARDVDARTDVWSLGVILYELLTGRVPFAGETLPEVCVKIATEPPPSMASLRPSLPPALEQVVMRCLDKDRARRFADVAELAAGLAAFAPARARTSVERVARIVAASNPQRTSVTSLPSSLPDSAGHHDEGTFASWGKTQGGRARRNSRLLGLSLLGVGATAGAAAWLLGRSPIPEPPSTALVSAAPTVAPSRQVAAAEPVDTVTPAPVAASPTASSAVAKQAALPLPNPRRPTRSGPEPISSASARAPAPGAAPREPAPALSSAPARAQPKSPGLGGRW